MNVHVHEMEVMDASGHTTVRWDPDNADEVAAARATFDEMTKKGYRAFRMRKGKRQGEQIDRFDPSIGRMILAAPLRGG